MSPFYTSFRKVLTKGEVSSPSPHSPSLRVLLKGLSLFFLLPSLSFGQDWTREDTYRQSSLTALLIADWAQTRYTAKNPRAFREYNNFLSDHPSVGKVNNYFATGIVAHAAIAYALPSAWRQGWQYVWIGMELEKVTHNRKIGVRMSF